MIRIPGRIPITIHGPFWILAALIGFLSSYSLFGTLIWIGIILISVLFHEFGHALTALIFKQNPRIELIAFGGVTYHDADKLPFWKQLLITFNGPLFGFLLFIIASALMHIPSLAAGPMGPALALLRLVNLFWTFVNLLPVMPLDGGQLLRIILERIFGIKGLKYAVIVGTVIAFVIALAGFLYQQFFLGAFFFLLAFQSFDTLRRTRNYTESDRNEDLRHLLAQAETLLQEGKKDEAAAVCEDIRKRASRGILFALATQYLAFLRYEKGLSRECYQLLLSIKKDLANDGVCLLHKAAFDQRDFSLVVELGATSFQTLPTPETALRNSLAHAELKQSEPAIGWLRTAIQEGLINLDEIVKMPSFDLIRKESDFDDFLKSLHSPQK
jgi:stage IV sporulation protein FB